MTSSLTNQQLVSFHTNGNERAARRRRSNVGKFSVPNVAHCFVEDSLNFFEALFRLNTKQNGVCLFTGNQGNGKVLLETIVIA